MWILIANFGLPILLVRKLCFTGWKWIHTPEGVVPCGPFQRLSIDVNSLRHKALRHYTGRHYTYSGTIGRGHFTTHATTPDGRHYSGQRPL